MSDTNIEMLKKPNSKNSDKVWVIIPAAGIGKRMQSDTPKQYLKINNKTVLEHTLNCFLTHSEVAGIIVVLNTDDYLWKSIKLKPNLKIPLFTVEGGKERSHSVMQGLDYLSMVERLSDNSWVMVHDAARPCLLKEDIDSLLSIRSNNCVGGILASPVRDTMKRAVTDADMSMTSKTISNTESRDNLWHALTPQLFRIGELKDALNYCIDKGLSITDESSALEALDKKVQLVEGNMNNIKITLQADFEVASLLLSAKESTT